MRERPILFSGPMVRAILDGRKTQTRRIIEPQPSNPEVFGVSPIWGSGIPVNLERVPRKAWPSPATSRRPWESFGLHAATNDHGKRRDLWISCPHGRPGDRLWVREAWATAPNFDYLPPRKLTPGIAILRRADKGATGGRWRPSIFMPRWAARITLGLVDIRAERLQAIPDVDCEAEGILPASEGTARDWRENESGWRRTYRQLWDSLNAKRGFGWDANPWVWVLSFRLVGEARAAA